MISKFFIEHPVLANVLAIVLVLIGAICVLRLPVAQYPNVTPPTVQVTTRYPGASPQTVVDTVALPIELQVNGVQGMLYMESTSAYDGTYVLTVTFQIGSDPNMDQVLVQNRVTNAMAQLPEAVQAQGVAIRAKSSSILEFVTLNSPDGSRDALYMWNYATINLVNDLARLPGVGNVAVMGAGEYSMRIWMDPQKLYSYGLVPEDVIRVIRQQSQEVAAGQVGMPPAPKDQQFQYTVDIQSRLDNPNQFGDIIVKDQTAQGGKLVRLRDVARIELGAQTYAQDFKLDGKPAAGIAIYQTPDANSLKVAGEVAAKMAELARRFPPGLHYTIPYNTTIFVKNSISEVYKTLWQAGVLVLIVILVFLQNLRATLVPATTVPVTIIGAFAGMAALGYTVNLSTLFALILAIGIVVDDAIVIVEGVSKYIEQGMSGHDAAIRAMNELFGPIVGITLVLMAVFLPSAFVPGLSGQIFAQFALVIAVTALISAVNAATLKPTQCALWLRTPKPVAQRNFFYRGFDRAYGHMENGYAGLIGRMVRHAGLMVLIGVALAVLAVWGIARLPTAFIPNEDQGYLMIAAQLPDGATLGRTHGGTRQRDQDRHGHPRGPDGDLDRRHVGARQQRRPRQRRRQFCRAEAVGRAQQGQRHRHHLDRRASAKSAQPRARRKAVRAGPAADPGHRQRRRLSDADRDAGRKFRLSEAQRRHPADRQEGRRRSPAAARADHLPPRRAAGGGDRRSRPGADPAGVGRRHLLGAERLSRLDLCQPVQQIRPVLAGLCPGRFEIPPAPGRSAQSLCAQPGREHGPDRCGRAFELGGRPAAGHALQPLPVGDDRRRRGAGLQLGPVAARRWNKSPRKPCRPGFPTNGRRCRIRKS